MPQKKPSPPRKSAKKRSSKKKTLTEEEELAKELLKEDDNIDGIPITVPKEDGVTPEPTEDVEPELNTLRPVPVTSDLESREGKPWVIDQIENHPESVSLSRVVCYIFKLGNEKGLRAYNKEITSVETEPGYELADSERNWCNLTGQYIVIMHVNILRFKNILPKAGR